MNSIQHVTLLLLLKYTSPIRTYPMLSVVVAMAPSALPGQYHSIHDYTSRSCNH